MKKNVPLIIIIIVLLLVIVALISYIFLNQGDKESSKLNQIANPAAVYCHDNGYEYEIRTKDTGDQYGVCIFPDKSECDAWDYLCSCGFDERYCMNQSDVCKSKCD